MNRPGEELSVNSAGTTMPYRDQRMCKPRKAQILVASLGFSHYTYVEAAPDQRLANWVDAHPRALTFFGAGVH